MINMITKIAAITIPTITKYWSLIPGSFEVESIRGYIGGAILVVTAVLLV